MKFQYNDGGRAKAGFIGVTSDCVTRAIAIATEQSYMVVYHALNELAKQERTSKRKRGISNARTGVYKCTQNRYLKSLGWTWTPTMFVGSGCKIHLVAEELPAGRLIVGLSKHSVAVIDGVIHDIYNPQREIAEFRQFPGWQTAILKANEQRNQNGIFVIRRRCVYGYFQKVGQ